MTEDQQAEVAATAVIAATHPEETDSRKCVFLKMDVIGASTIFSGKTPCTHNMDPQNDGLEKATPFKHGNCWYLC